MANTYKKSSKAKISHQRNENENHNEIPLYTPQDSYNKNKTKQKIIDISENVDKLETYIAGENITEQTLENSSAILQQVKHRITTCQSLSSVRGFVNPWTVAHQAPLSMGFPRQEYWSGLPFPSPGNLPDPGIELRSPALQADSLLSEPPGKPIWPRNPLPRC